MMQFRAAVCAALFVLVGVSSSLAQDVLLKSHDGEVEISGTLLAFHRETSPVDTVYGHPTLYRLWPTCTVPC